MLIATIAVIDEWNPIEVQTWLGNNPSVTIRFINLRDNLVYIFYE